MPGKSGSDGLVGRKSAESVLRSPAHSGGTPLAGRLRPCLGKVESAPFRRRTLASSADGRSEIFNLAPQLCSHITLGGGRQISQPRLGSLGNHENPLLFIENQLVFMIFINFSMKINGFS